MKYLLALLFLLCSSVQAQVLQNGTNTTYVGVSVPVIEPTDENPTPPAPTVSVSIKGQSIGCTRFSRSCQRCTGNFAAVPTLTATDGTIYAMSYAGAFYWVQVPGGSYTLQATTTVAGSGAAQCTLSVQIQ